ncbi:uncharacterized protein BX664DRAFT_315959 [Halteromyces radiatus]|uniref:uncharacterized protein n=1 Tax=Halteromyces radiatus TaxID=101107 RepID=UPI002220BE86|nr:uncharacterized protein BX664DRAFT_315959 [Halteromyces radiatus]KAI8086793.1 hypothetical protein BX664DRAFT_315959 [Halteromyces radiatus]
MYKHISCSFLFYSLSLRQIRSSCGLHCKKYIGRQQRRNGSSTSQQDYDSLTTDPAVAAQYFRPSSGSSSLLPYKRLVQDFILLPNFISKEEHDIIVQHCEKKLKRSLGRHAPYEQGHFDGVITGYKECNASSWATPTHGGVDEWMSQFIQQRIYSLFPSSFEWLSPHILDLNAQGEIRGHVDNVEASGSVVAGLCLKSPVKMTLEHQDNVDCRVDVFLPTSCFYIQRDYVRYHFKHAVAGPSQSIWDDKPFDKYDRISLLFRTIRNDSRSK